MFSPCNAIFSFALKNLSLIQYLLLILREDTVCAYNSIHITRKQVEWKKVCPSVQLCITTLALI